MQAITIKLMALTHLHHLPIYLFFKRVVLLNQYKVLRNKVTSQIQKENVDFNNNRIEEAKYKYHNTVKCCYLYTLIV